MQAMGVVDALRRVRIPRSTEPARRAAAPSLSAGRLNALRSGPAAIMRMRKSLGAGTREAAIMGAEKACAAPSAASSSIGTEDPIGERGAGLVRNVHRLKIYDREEP
jgi:hypothetical protein